MDEFINRFTVERMGRIFQTLHLDYQTISKPCEIEHFTRLEWSRSLGFCLVGPAFNDPLLPLGEATDAILEQAYPIFKEICCEIITDSKFISDTENKTK